MMGWLMWNFYWWLLGQWPWAARRIHGAKCPRWCRGSDIPRQACDSKEASKLDRGGTGT